MPKTIDVNKDTIMNMLRTDVFGFKPVDIEAKAKEIFHLVGGGSNEAAVMHINGYGRNSNGFIVLSRIGGSSKSKNSRK